MPSRERYSEAERVHRSAWLRVRAAIVAACVNFTAMVALLVAGEVLLGMMRAELEAVEQVPDQSNCDAIRISLTKQQLAEVVGAELGVGDDERDLIRQALGVLDDLGVLVREVEQVPRESDSRMRVKIELTVAVDCTEWAETYGCDDDAASVRDDVKRWAATTLSHHPDGLVELVGLARLRAGGPEQVSGQSYLSPKPSAGTPHASGPAAPVGTDADGAAPTAVLERIHQPTMPGPGGLQRVSPWWRAAVTGHSYVTPEHRHD